MATILLADDNPSTRSALRLMFSARLGLNDIQEVMDWKALLEITAQEQPVNARGNSRDNPRISPDQRVTVVLLDWELPGCPTHERQAHLQLILPRCKIIALSARLEARQEALQAGADAFIAKSDPPERVIEVIRSLIENCP